MTAPIDLPGRQALGELFSLDSAQVESLPWEPVPDCPGAARKVLWQLGSFVQALLHYEPGAQGGGQAHLAAHHHMWVVSGAATIAGRRLTAGSYMHVPPGVDHPVTDVSADGLVLLQMHRPHAPVEAEHLAERH